MQRFRPSLLNLDTISRNLFGSASISTRSQSYSSDHFGTSNTKRPKSVMSRSSTQSSAPRRQSASMGSALGHDGARLARIPSGQSAHMSDVEAAEPSKPYAHRGMGQSEIDLNERLNLARKNSKTIAAMSPGPHSRLGAKSVGELRHQAEQHENGPVELRRRNSNVEQAIEAEATMRDAMRAGSPSPLSPTSGPQTPLSPTAPLRFRSKTPSPTRALSPTTDDTPKAPKRQDVGLFDASISLDAMIAATAVSNALSPRSIPTGHLRSPASHEVLRDGLAADHLRSPVSYEAIRSPPPHEITQGSARFMMDSAPASPRPQGPRSPGPRNTPLYPGLGSGHTSLRVVSGNGRKVTPGRETMPLQSDDASPFVSSSRIPSAKRQRSADQLSPRKRSSSQSPAEVAEGGSERVPDPLPVPSLTKKGTPRKNPSIPLKTDSPRSSGPLTPMRRVSSAECPSIMSQKTGSTINDEVATVDNPSASAAVDSARSNVSFTRVERG